MNQLAEQVCQVSQIEADQEEALKSLLTQVEYLDTRVTDLQQNNVTLTLELDDARKEIARLNIKDLEIQQDTQGNNEDMPDRSKQVNSDSTCNAREVTKKEKKRYIEPVQDLHLHTLIGVGGSILHVILAVLT